MAGTGDVRSAQREILPLRSEWRVFGMSKAAMNSALIVAVPRLARPHRLEAFATIDRFVVSRLERHLGFAAAIRADGRIELAGAARVSAATVAPSAAIAVAAVTAGIIGASIRVSLRLAASPAGWASRRRRKSSFLVKRLFPFSEGEFSSAITTCECLITHSLEYSSTWLTHALTRKLPKSDMSCGTRHVTVVLKGTRIECACRGFVVILLYYERRKVNRRDAV